MRLHAESSKKPAVLYLLQIMITLINTKGKYKKDDYWSLNNDFVDPH